MFQCKSSCSITPKYLTWFVGLIFWPLCRKLWCLVIVLFVGLNIIISIFLAFKESLFALTQSTISFRSLLTFLSNCLRDFLTTRRFASSANWWIFCIEQQDGHHWWLTCVTEKLKKTKQIRCYDKISVKFWKIDRGWKYLNVPGRCCV